MNDSNTYVQIIKTIDQKNRATDEHILGMAFVVAFSNAVARKMRKQRIGFSKWLLGGAFTLVFALLIDPAKMYESYGRDFVRLYIVLLITSILCGSFFVIVENISKLFISDGLVRSMLEYEIRRRQDSEEKAVEKPPAPFETKSELVTATVKKLYRDWKGNLRGCFTLVVQTLTLGCVLGGLLLQLLFFESASKEKLYVIGKENNKTSSNISYYSQQLCQR